MLLLKNTLITHHSNYFLQQLQEKLNHHLTVCYVLPYVLLTQTMVPSPAKYPLPQRWQILPREFLALSRFMLCLPRLTQI